MILTKTNIKKVNLQSLIDEKIKYNKVEELLLIVPTNRKLRSLKKEIISQSPNKALTQINIETLSTITIKILSADEEEVNLISEAASSVLLKQSFQEVRLTYFNSYKDEIPVGSLDRIKRVISEYKLHGISPARLMVESEKLEGSEKNKAIDLANVFLKYNEKFSLLGVKDIGDVYEDINKIDSVIFTERFHKLFPQVKLIIIKGFSEFTSPEVEILNSLSQLPGTGLYIDFDYNKDNQYLFGHLNDCFNKLTLKKFNIIPEDALSTDSPFIEKVRENLFNFKNTGINSSYGGLISLIKTGSLEDEITSVVKEIKRLITEENTEPHHICVAFNLIAKYSSIVRDKFNIYGVPFNLTDRFNLSSFIPVISIISLLEILENDFYYKNIFRTLSGEYIKPLKVSLYDLMRTASDLKIIAGHNGWINAINFFLGNVRDDDDNESILAKKEIYKNVLMEISEIDNLLAPFKEKLTLKEFSQRLKDLIFTLKIPQKILQLSKGSEEENLKALTTFIETFSELFELLKQEYKEDNKFSIRFFLNHLKTAVTSARFNIKEKSNYGVQVTTLNEIRGLKFDYLFISGMCDGDLPTRYMPEVFYSGSFAKSEQKHQLEERYLFYQALCAWNKKLYLSYPVSDGKKELVESNFVSVLKNVFKINEVNKTAAQDKIYSRQELIEAAGKYSGGTFLDKINLDEAGIDIKKISSAIETDKLRHDITIKQNPFGGFVNNNLSAGTAKKLSDYLKKKYSISQLETYALCPFKYFAERVLQLQAIAEPSEEFEALEMGSLLHSILYEFYKTISREKIILNGCSDDVFNRAVDIMFKIAEEKTGMVNLDFPLAFFEKEKILGINGNRKQSVLYKFVEKEREIESKFTPAYFEIPFGGVRNEEGKYEYKSLVNFKVGDVEVRGKIDRIDIDKEDNSFKLIDYKLGGKMPKKDDLKQGLSLQMPLYLHAANKLIMEETGENLDPAVAEIYSLKMKESDFGPKVVKISDTRKNYETADEKTRQELIESNKEMIKICLDKITEYVSSIAGGEFNLSTLPDRKEKVCKYCDFAGICRVNEFEE